MLQLRQERLKKGLTLTEVSRRTGIPVPTLSNIERGKAHAWPKYQRLLAQSLRIKKEILFQEAQESGLGYS